VLKLELGIVKGVIPTSEGDQLEHKHARGSRTYVETDASCNEISNRTLTVIYGTDGTMM
jgi:hypothetical protein